MYDYLINTLFSSSPNKFVFSIWVYVNNSYINANLFGLMQLSGEKSK